MWGLAVAVVAILGLLAVPAVVNATTPAAAPYVRPSDAFAEPTPTPDPLSVVVLGDSYTAGSDMGGGNGTGWPVAFAEATGWTVALNAVGGSGYIQPGATLPSFAERVPEVIAAAPDVVIVEGGLNDASYPPEDVTAAASAQWSALQAGLPDARIVVVGPFNPTGAENVAVLNESLRAAAESAGLTYIDALPWMDAIEIGSDGIHPTDAGHAVIAENMIAALGSLGR